MRMAPQCNLAIFCATLAVDGRMHFPAQTSAPSRWLRQLCSWCRLLRFTGRAAVCSFIPVAGCIISTFPIGFVALTEYGFMKLALVILMVFGVHIVEAYGLNPAIYSAHLRLHPLLVLAVLVVAEHSLGVWGLLLAVPLTVFTLDYCIRCARDARRREACHVLGIRLVCV
jgi:AI-2E family transporter